MSDSMTNSNIGDRNEKDDSIVLFTVPRTIAEYGNRFLSYLWETFKYNLRTTAIPCGLIAAITTYQGQHLPEHYVGHKRIPRCPDDVAEPYIYKTPLTGFFVGTLVGSTTGWFGIGYLILNLMNFREAYQNDLYTGGCNKILSEFSETVNFICKNKKNLLDW